MGNTDSKRGSTDSIMGCQPNRTRQFSELPDGFQSLLAAQKRAASDAGAARLAVRRLRGGHNNNNKPHNNHDNNAERNDNKENNNSSNSKNNNDGGRWGSGGTPPIFVGEHRSLSPQQSDSGASLSTLLGDTPVAAGGGGGSGVRSANASFRAVRMASPMNADNTSLQSVQLSGRPMARAAMARRAKSFRNPSSGSRCASASFRRPTCALTGLTDRQKRLIALTWREMDARTARAMIHAIFEALHRRDARLLHFVADAVEEDWRYSPRLRLHVQRFHDALSETIRTLNAPTLSADRLVELGAEYELMLNHNNNNNNHHNNNNDDNTLGDLTAGEAARNRDRVVRRANSADRPAVDAAGTFERDSRTAPLESPSASSTSASTSSSSAAARKRDSKSSSEFGAPITPPPRRGRRIPLHYWEALIAAFIDAVHQVYCERQNGTVRHHCHQNDPEPGSHNNGFHNNYNGYNNNNMSVSESVSPLYLTVGDAPPPPLFRLTPSPSPTNASAISRGDDASLPSPSFLYPSFNAGRNSASPTTTVSDYGSDIAAVDRPISRHGYGSHSFNASSATHRSAAGHYMSAPSYGNFGIASPLAVSSSATPSSNTVESSFLFTPRQTPQPHGGSIRRRQFQPSAQTASRVAPAVEAWSLLAVYVVGQMRFGYEMECALQEQSARLAKALTANEEDDGGDKSDDGDGTPVDGTPAGDPNSSSNRQVSVELRFQSQTVDHVASAQQPGPKSACHHTTANAASQSHHRVGSCNSYRISVDFRANAGDSRVRKHNACKSVG